MRVVNGRRPELLAVWLVIAVGASLLLAVSAGAKPQKPNKKTEVSLRLMTGTTWVLPTNIMVANFQRVYPDIKITTEFVPAATLATVYQTQFRAGNAADIFQVTPGRGNALGALVYAEQNYLVDLAGRPWEKYITKVQLIGAKQGKKLWDASMGVSLAALVYNRDLFKQVGVTKIPTNWAEMITACKKFVAAGKLFMLFQGADPLNGTTLGSILAVSDVLGPNPNANVERQAGKTRFATSKEWRRVLEHFGELKSNGCLSPGAAGVLQPTALAQFAKGEAGIIPTQTGALGAIQALNPQFKLGVMASPADKAADTRVAINPSWAAAINSTISAEKKAAALKFIDFIQRPKQTETFDKAAGLLLSGYVLKTGKFPSWAEPYLDVVGPLIKQSKTGVIPIIVWPNAGVGLALYQGFVGQLTGQKTIDQALADMDTAFNQGAGGGR